MEQPVDFVNRAIQGEISVREVDRYISTWMNEEYSQKTPREMKPLWVFLGMPRHWYLRWVAGESLAEVLRGIYGEWYPADPEADGRVSTPPPPEDEPSTQRERDYYPEDCPY